MPSRTNKTGEDLWSQNAARALLHRVERETTVLTWYNHFSVCRAIAARIDPGAFTHVLVDGVLLRRILRRSELPRTSADLVIPRLFAAADLAKKPLNVALVGSTRSNVEATAAWVRQNFTYVIPTHVSDGFAPLPLWSDFSGTGAPHIVIAGLGAPLQDEYLSELATGAPVGSLLLTCGGWLDQVHRQFYYPAWAYRFRVNWLFRLLLEPKRLWRRYSTEAVRACSMRSQIRDYLNDAVLRTGVALSRAEPEINGPAADYSRG